MEPTPTAPRAVATLLLTVVSGLFVGARAQDSIDVTVSPGPGPDELSLSWTGGTPSFEVYRSTDPATVSDPANWIGTTDQPSWIDQPPALQNDFYRVLECPPCAPCGGAMDVDEPGGRFNVMLTGSRDVGSCGGAGLEGGLTFTLTQFSDVFITTHQAGDVDTVLYIREEGCGGTEIACNDDADGRNTSMLSLTALAPGSYTVFVDSETMTAGSVPVDLYISPPGQPSDRCGHPTTIPPGTTSLTGTTFGFSSDYVPATSTECSFSGTGTAEDRVFYFYLDAAGTVSFDGCNALSDYDQTVFVRSICTDGTPVSQPACNDDGCAGLPYCSSSSRYRSSLSVALPAGLHYLFIDGNGASTCPAGNYEFSISGL